MNIKHFNMKTRPRNYLARFAWTTCQRCEPRCLYRQLRYRSFFESFALGIIYAFLIAVLTFIFIVGLSEIIGMLVPVVPVNGTFTR